jgi:3D (Asp-Asp-Asp) domain-containing protein
MLLLFVVVSITSGLSFDKGKPYVATAYALRGKTASGIYVRRGIVAADRRVHKLGSKVYVEAGKYSGVYLVADTGGKIKGNRIDIWMSSRKEALQFGKRKVIVKRAIIN